ncbi:MAG: hypothetical protein ACREU2_10235 [Steroidobacteraceae bacterium]
MYQGLLCEVGFYRLLLRLDEDLAQAERSLGCWRCGQALHVSDYARKPRGVPAGLGERYRERLSFCCADRQCRKRRTPPSLRFLGPKVYLGAVVVLISAMRCGPTPARMRRLHELVGVSRHTVARWRAWWSEQLPDTRFWQGAAGTLMPPVCVRALPASLLERFVGTCEQQLLSLLRMLLPISTGSRPVHVA